MASSSRTAATESGLSTSATAISPATLPSTTTYMGVLPSLAMASAAVPSSPGGELRSSSRRRLPSST